MSDISIINLPDFGDFEDFDRRIKQSGCSNGHGGL